MFPERTVHIFSELLDIDVKQLLLSFDQNWSIIISPHKIVFGAIEEYSFTVSSTKRFLHSRVNIQEVFQSIIYHSDGPPPFFLGGFSFDNRDGGDMWQGFPNGKFVLYRYQITSTNDGLYLSIVHYDSSPTDLAEEWRQVANKIISATSSIKLEGKIHTIVPLTTKEQWIKQVEEGKNLIQQGELKKIVLSRVLEIHHSGSLSLSTFMKLVEQYPDANCYFFNFNGHHFFGATPETLVQKESNIVHTEALAGSHVRGIDERQDMVFENELLSSTKDLQEHIVVRDNVVNTLQRFALNYSVAPTPVVKRLSYILHLHSEITAEVYPWVHLFHLVEELHPTPALGGEPKDKTIHWIKQLETNVRGWYGAPIGWVDADGDGHFFVAIRSAKSSGKKTWIFAGAGIMQNSDPILEWKETELKFHPILKAMKGE